MDKRMSTVFASSEALFRKYKLFLMRGVTVATLYGAFAGPHLCGQEKISDPEAYKIQFGGQFWYATPTATLAGSSTQVPIDFDKSLGFQTYSTFNGGVDWHFKKKHHLFFIASPNQTSRSSILNQTITFRNTTFEAGSSVSSQLRTYSFAPGYRYDLIHRPWGHLSIVTQINLLDIKATITGVALQSSGQTSASASGSVF